MRSFFSLFASTLILASISFAQIPNAGFEQWTGGNPDGWFTGNIPGFVVPITQSSTSHSGLSSARAEVVNFGGNPFPPTLVTIFPVSQSHAILTFWHQFAPVSGDGAGVAVIMYDNQQAIAGGFGETYSATSGWEQVQIELEYFLPGVPDSCYISFSVYGDSLGGAPHLGSALLVDDLAFSGISSAGDEAGLPASYRLHQNFPNPFNPATTITYDLPSSGHVILKVYNLIGQEVATLVNELQEAGNKSVHFDAARFTSGVYMYRLSVNGNVFTQRMTLLK